MTERSETVASVDQEQLAKRLREAREFLNLSQQFVSEQTGIPRSAISDIERGERRVESLELKRLAAIYRMPAAYFLGEDQGAEVGEGEDATVEALARAASQMNESEKEQVLRFALFLQNYEGKPSGSERA
jgi:transcriptional regulator with XRE-family HTH domain